MDYLINCEAYVVTIKDNIKIEYPTGFYMYPRSSIYKTPLRMANCVGIIDSGYRGNVKAHFDCAPTFCSTEINMYDRLVQLCAPSLMPIYIELVETKEELSTTSRGNNGFGSTGK
jgi:dUTP pyrophosphatase